MRFLRWLAIVVFVVVSEAHASSTRSASATPRSLKRSEAQKHSRVFADAVTKYVKLVHTLDSSVVAQKTTNESEQITTRQHELAGLVANARRDAIQGEIFTHEV